MKIICLFFFILGLVFQSQLWLGKTSLFARWRLQNKIEIQLTSNRHLEKTNILLAKEINDVQKNKNIIETIARSELGLIKKGEEFYQFFD